MDINKTGKIVSILIVAVVAIAGLFLPLDVTVQPVEDFGSRSVSLTNFRSVVVDHNLTVGDTLTTVDLTVTDDIALTDDAAVGGDLTVTGDATASADLTLADWLVISPQTAISLTAAAIITPTGSYQPLTSAVTVTTSTSTAIMSGTVEGQFVILRNDNAADTITIDGTGGNVECKADVVLGAEDTLTLIWNAVDWVCVSGYDNS